MTVESSSSKNLGVIYGLINGGVAIVFTVILYLGGAKTFVSPIAYLGTVLPIVVCVIGALQIRKQHGGYLEFSEALKNTFLILVIGSLLATLFHYILFNFIDVSFREALAQETAEKVQQLMHKFGAPEEKIDKAVEETMSKNNYTVGKLLLGFVFGCIWWFIVALIVSAIIKRKRSPFENSFNQ
jgi:cytochrome c biogenesis protein CcdA